MTCSCTSTQVGDCVTYKRFYATYLFNYILGYLLYVFFSDDDTLKGFVVAVHGNWSVNFLQDFKFTFVVFQQPRQG